MRGDVSFEEYLGLVPVPRLTYLGDLDVALQGHDLMEDQAIDLFGPRPNGNDTMNLPVRCPRRYQAVLFYMKVCGRKGSGDRPGYGGQIITKIAADKVVEEAG